MSVGGCKVPPDLHGDLAPHELITADLLAPARSLLASVASDVANFVYAVDLDPQLSPNRVGDSQSTGNVHLGHDDGVASVTILAGHATQELPVESVDVEVGG